MFVHRISFTISASRSLSLLRYVAQHLLIKQHVLMALMRLSWIFFDFFYCLSDLIN